MGMGWDGCGSRFYLGFFWDPAWRRKERESEVSLVIIIWLLSYGEGERRGGRRVGKKELDDVVFTLEYGLRVKGGFGMLGMILYVWNCTTLFFR